ncbi:MAG: hypothetical protein ACFFD4_31125 [Candidatus Odinarchaeota archaeon]
MRHGGLPTFTAEGSLRGLMNVASEWQNSCSRNFPRHFQEETTNSSTLPLDKLCEPVFIMKARGMSQLLMPSRFILWSYREEEDTFAEKFRNYIYAAYIPFYEI